MKSDGRIWIHTRIQSGEGVIMGFLHRFGMDSCHELGWIRIWIHTRIQGVFTQGFSMGTYMTPHGFVLGLVYGFGTDWYLYSCTNSNRFIFGFVQELRMASGLDSHMESE